MVCNRGLPNHQTNRLLLFKRGRTRRKISIGWTTTPAITPKVLFPWMAESTSQPIGLVNHSHWYGNALLLPASTGANVSPNFHVQDSGDISPKPEDERCLSGYIHGNIVYSSRSCPSTEFEVAIHGEHGVLDVFVRVQTCRGKIKKDNVTDHAIW